MSSATGAPLLPPPTFCTASHRLGSPKLRGKRRLDADPGSATGSLCDLGHVTLLLGASDSLSICCEWLPQLLCPGVERGGDAPPHTMEGRQRRSEACAKVHSLAPEGQHGSSTPGMAVRPVCSRNGAVAGWQWLLPCLGRPGLGHPARQLHLGYRCGARLGRQAAPDIPWSPSQQGGVVSPHPGEKCKLPLGLAHGNPLSVCQHCPPGQTPESPHAPPALTAGRYSCPWPRTPLPTSKSVSLLSSRSLLAHHSGWVRQPLWAPSSPCMAWPALSDAGQGLSPSLPPKGGP